MEEAKEEPIATAMRPRRLEWFGHVKRRDETENIRAVAEIKREGKRDQGVQFVTSGCEHILLDRRVLGRVPENAE